MYTPSFVEIPDGGLKIPQKLFELAWNDPQNKKVTEFRFIKFVLAI